jgi:hypothetical protein
MMSGMTVNKFRRFGSANVLSSQRAPLQPREIADLGAFPFGPSGRSNTGQRMVVCAGASL